MSNANQMQIGGSHYKPGEDSYQHWDWVEDIGLGYLEGNASKYIVRWRQKNGVEDLKKAGHYVAKLKELGRPNRSKDMLHVEIMAKHNRLMKSLGDIGPVEGYMLLTLISWRDVHDLDMIEIVLKELIEFEEK